LAGDRCPDRCPPLHRPRDTAGTHPAKSGDYCGATGAREGCRRCPRSARMIRDASPIVCRGICGFAAVLSCNGGAVGAERICSRVDCVEIARAAATVSLAGRPRRFIGWTVRHHLGPAGITGKSPIDNRSRVVVPAVATNVSASWVLLRERCASFSIRYAIGFLGSVGIRWRGGPPLAALEQWTMDTVWKRPLDVLCCNAVLVPDGDLCCAIGLVDLSGTPSKAKAESSCQQYVRPLRVFPHRQHQRHLPRVRQPGPESTRRRKPPACVNEPPPPLHRPRDPARTHAAKSGDQWRATGAESGAQSPPPLHLPCDSR
jgi:hypothetical protein